MPTQRTLLLSIAGLLVMVSFLVGYISGHSSVPSSSDLSLNNSVRVSGVKPAQTKKGDPVLKQAGSSLNTVPEKEGGKPGASQNFAGQNGIDQNGHEVIAEQKPKYTFRPIAKPKKAYSWRYKKQDDFARAGEPHFTAAIPLGQGNGYLVQPRMRKVLPAVRGQQYYYLAPPTTSYYGTTSPLPVPAPMMQNPYPGGYMASPSYYVPYMR